MLPELASRSEASAKAQLEQMQDVEPSDAVQFRRFDSNCVNSTEIELAAGPLKET